MQELLSFFAHQLGVISDFGDNPIVVILTVILVIYVLAERKHKNTSVIAFLTLLSYVYSLFLKYLFRMSRPSTADLASIRTYDLFSFPSSHVVFYTVFWGFLLYLTFKYVKEAKLLMHVIRTAAIYFIVMVGISRIFLGFHYLRDIIGGYVFGGIFLMLLVALDKHFEKEFSKDKKKNN